MALNLTKFKADLENEIDTEVDKYIRSGTVKTQVDVTSVSTTVKGTCATPAGAGTISGT